MKKIAAALLLLLLILTQPMGTLAQSEVSLQKKFQGYIQAEDYLRAAQTIKKMIRDNPVSGLNWFNLGNTYFVMKSFGSAEKAYKKVIELNSPLKPAAQLYIARSLRNRRLYLKATKALEKVKRRNLPPGLRREYYEERQVLANKSLKRALKLYRAKSYDNSLEYLMASHRMRKSSNALLLASLIAKKKNYEKASLKLIQKSLRFAKSQSDKSLISRAARSIKGTSLEVNQKTINLDMALTWDNNGFRSQADTEPDSRSGLFASTTYYHPLKNNKDKRSAWRALLSWDEVFKDREERFQSYELHYASQNLFKKSSFGIQPGFRHEFLDSTTYSLNTYISAQFSYTGLPFLIGADTTLTQIEAGATEFDYVAGQSQLFNIYISHTFFSSLIKLGYLLEANDTKNFESGTSRLPLANTTLGPYMSIIYKLPYNWVSDWKVSFLKSTYWNNVLPSDTERIDETFKASLILKRPISQSLQGYLSLEYLDNSSTMNTSSGFDKNYSQATAYVGAFWTFQL